MYVPVSDSSLEYPVNLELFGWLATKITVVGLTHFHPNSLINPYMSLVSGILLNWRIAFLGQPCICSGRHLQEEINLHKARET